MTRKEEREKTSIEYQMSVSPVVVGGAAFADDVEVFNINPSFVAGAKWADKTMIEKACEWLKECAEHYYGVEGEYSDKVDLIFCKEELLEDFKKAMMEE